MSRRFTLRVVDAAGRHQRELELSSLAGQRDIRWSEQVALSVFAPTVRRGQDVAPQRDEIAIHCLRDPVLGRTIEHTYRTVVLSEEVSP